MEAFEQTSTLPAFDPLWNFSDPASTATKFRELLPAARKSGDRDYLAQLLTQIARTEGLQSKFDDAHRILNEVEPDLATLSPSTNVRYLLERGRTFHSSGEKMKAKELFVKAWDLAREFGEEYYAVYAAHMVVIAGEPQ